MSEKERLRRAITNFDWRQVSFLINGMYRRSGKTPKALTARVLALVIEDLYPELEIAPYMPFFERVATFVQYRGSGRA